MKKRSLTPKKRHEIRAMYEKQAQERKNERLGIKPKMVKKGKRK